MYILGISAFYHDSAAALILDGKIIAAAQEERFSRIKNDPGFPFQSIQYCLSEAKIELKDVHVISFYEDTHLKFDRIVKTYFYYLPKSFLAFYRALSVWISEKIYIEDLIREKLKFKGEIINVPHHISHAASAFYPSQFKNAAILVIDGVGEWACTSIGEGKEHAVNILKEIRYPHSLGMLYSAFTQFSGFRVNSGEYKLMGLAPYGEPIYQEKIKQHLIDIKEDGSYQLNLKFFDFHHGSSTINANFEALFEAKAREPESEIRKIDQDMAASIQAVFNDIIVQLAQTAKNLTKHNNLVIAGGVGLNCVANGHIASKKIFENIWVQPAAGDAGGALGCALYTFYHLKENRRNLTQTHQGASLIGPSFSDEEIKHYLDMWGIKYQKATSDAAWADDVTNLLIQEKVIGIFQGRMEFGPRALGARSIIGDPRSEKLQRVMNLRIKYRESFRPFAPAVMREFAQEYFEMDYHSPYMQFVVPLKESQRLNVKENQRVTGIEKLLQKRSLLPAITHVDYSARVQTVDRKENPAFYSLLESFYKKTGCPVLINTSFNVRGEPIISSPEDALRCFFSSDIDVLVMEKFFIFRENQDYEKIGLMYRMPEYLEA